MIVREMLNVQVPICKVCQGALGRIMVYRDDYKGHLYFCKDCGTEYKIVGQGQAENELLMEYERNEKFDLVRDADVEEKPDVIKLEKEDER